MSNPDNQTTREMTWRQPISPDDEKRLAKLIHANPELRSEVEEERALTAFLKQLSDVPIAADFTQSVLQKLDANCAQTNIIAVPFWRQSFAKAAALVVAAGLSWLGLLQYENYQEARLAQSVAMISRLTQPLGTSNLEELRNADAIQFMDADDELILALESK